MNPRNRGIVAEFFNQIASMFGDWVIRIIINLATGDNWHPLIKQARQTANDTRLGLTSLSQKDHVMASQNGVL